MHLRTLVALAISGVAFAANGQYPFDVTTIAAPDGSITAKYVSIGATLTELWVKDRHGKPRDVILGYDDNTKLLTDPAHPYFNGIVGRYANRIKNGTFSIPITKDPQPDGPNVYHTPLNNHNDEVTLHGGILGYDRRNWTIVAKSPTSVTYKHIDTADEGFPGNVTTYATHAVHNGGVMTLKLHASATQKTPILLSQHLYLNLDAFQDGVDTILDHHMKFAASRVIDVDGDQIPTGKFIDVKGTPFDFRQGETIGARINQTIGLCGAGCNGYDHAWVFDRAVDSSPRTSLWSEKSGIRLDISSNQPAVQHYSSYTLNITRKAIHGGPNKVYGSFSAAVLEQEGYIDAINTPEWHVDQIYYPGKDYEWSATYKFSQLK